ncbi:putative pyridoxine 5'-phosphate oxidase superfamily flavin-nucleotide-binding protein [Aquimarina sp. EL_43]|uniref:pyridoxamine 5'-phosphate oxidase family protein n=1 Tax=unclassified Aquimarina TaxID=2627091 RepID=UPI0018C8EC6C|nr:MULTISPECIES: pyridoxamine 5'-phosphate oxidase family protein [unclassified Aquimarina]MBG6129787.1 putative pyridoxine 5'-phosphate oxidase superfamily flavin-nucleotide-binding protein [Aquimarina sp. EL_35]MBG6150852.1 putative pyridoxine 5'-phosphate oxidase superfamily flavin-nucleotide-binding protein [Aquimarina sp. EL_32]MBG6167841.1 putative pyridoxine 5'-phosphate oxidase superfamily flavin-nucleotide-binding protein [Aquimarina sp. EL_43]
MLTPEIKRYIDKSVLCWLATSSLDNIPNVSPKEVFTYYSDTTIIIANIASPQTVKNIKENNNVCVSFIDVFVQKGFQLKGVAKIVAKNDPEYAAMQTPLLQLTGGKFPFATITNIIVKDVKRIIAPKYVLYPETTEEQQIQSALKQYKP